MKWTVGISIAAVLSALSAQPAFARVLGGIGDGGGEGIVCRSPSGEVLSARLLDLQEAEDYYGLELESQPEDRFYLDIAREYGRRIGAAMPTSFPTSQWTRPSNGKVLAAGYEVGFGAVLRSDAAELWVEQILRLDDKKILVRGNSKLPPVGDSNPRILPIASNCQIEQVARYKDSNHHLYIQGPIWDKLKNVDKAALLVHEVLYRRLREFGEISSDRTRRTVAYLFAGLKFEHVLEGVADKFLTCWSDDQEAAFRFVVFPSVYGSLTVQFLVYNGEVMVTKTTATPPSGAFEFMFGKTVPKPENVVTFGELTNPMIESPYYAFSTSVDHLTGKVSTFLEAASLVSGNNKKRIACNNHLTTILNNGDGSFTIKSLPTIGRE